VKTDEAKAARSAVALLTASAHHDHRSFRDLLCEESDPKGVLACLVGLLAAFLDELEAEIPGSMDAYLAETGRRIAVADEGNQ
jgi:hypothetical protein